MTGSKTPTNRRRTKNANLPNAPKRKSPKARPDRKRAAVIAMQWEMLLRLRSELTTKRAQSVEWATTPPTSVVAHVFHATTAKIDARLDDIDRALLVTKSPTKALRALLPFAIGIEVRALVGVYRWLLSRTREGWIDEIQYCPAIVVTSATFAIERLRGVALRTGEDVAPSNIASAVPILEAALRVARNSIEFNRDGPRAGAIRATAHAISAAGGFAVSARLVERIVDAQDEKPLDREDWDRVIDEHRFIRNRP